jgi:four helix bundle protein
MNNSSSGNKQGNPILDISRRFSRNIIQYSLTLEQLRLRDIAIQLRRSATSVGANISEAQKAQSRADFMHKMKLAQKELQEAEYWIELCKDLPGCELSQEIEPDILSMRKLFSAIISSAIKGRTRSGD